MLDIGASQLSATAALEFLKSIFWAEPIARPARFSPLVETPTVRGNILLLPSRLLDEQIVGRSLRHHVVDLFLPIDSTLSREVELPTAAKRRIDDALVLDMIRATPFQPDDVYTTRSRATVQGNKLTVTQWIMKVRAIDALRSRLAELGIRLRRVQLETGSAIRPFADFSAEIAPHQRRWQIVNLLIVLAIGVTLVARTALPAIEAQHALAAIEQTNSELRATALAERTQFDEVAQTSSKRAEILAFVLDRPHLVGAIEALTAALPDDVWISDLTFAGNRITLAGNAGRSAAGVALSLGEDTSFSGARLSGPVARVADGQERFEITLDLAGSAG